MRLLVFAGAGCSVELGVPAMRELALELIDHLESVATDRTLLDRLKARLGEEAFDLESVIEDIDAIQGAEQVLPHYGGKLDPALLESARVTRAEIEWFVQHMCERVRAEDSAALWGPLATASDQVELVFATTNYDRGVELACQRAGVDLGDGFGQFGDRDWSTWMGFDTDGARLLKLHGSTDWYQVENSGEVVKLRHPMPLYGGVALQLENSGLGSLGSALVLPSREKRKNQPPFPEISAQLFAEARQADVAVFVGSSLRDPDIRSIVAICARRCQTIVVGPHTSLESELSDQVAQVRDFASGFLISTLPRMLATNEFPAPGTELEPLSGEDDPQSILADVVALTDPARSDDARSSAIETLWRRSVALGIPTLEELLAPAAGLVARDALALVPLSRDSERLLQRCRELAENSTDPGFQADVELLTEMHRPAD